MADLSDQDIVSAFLEATSDMSQSEIDRAVEGVSHDDVHRWRSGKWSRLSAKKRRSLTTFLQGRDGAGTDAPQLHDFEAAIRSFAGKNPDMSETERRARLRIAINAQIEARGALGEPIPGWLYELKSEVEDGRL